MKKQRIKKALVSSALALILCVSMLVGNTFAWFTDTASTGINKIQAGTLKVDLQKLTDDGTWVSVEGETLDFVANDGRDTILWEPGCTYSLPTVKVVNKGNLALKYTVQISGVVDGSSNINNADLLDVLELSVFVNDTKFFPKDDSVVTLKDALTSKDSDGFAHGKLAGGASSEELTISLHMKESAGNKYQGLTIKGISVTVFATQDTVENDSNDNLYDKDAKYSGSTLEQFLKDTANESGDTITLTGNYRYFNTDDEKQLLIEKTGSLTVNGNGNTLSIYGSDPTTGNDGYARFCADNVTVSDLTVTGTGFVELGKYAKNPSASRTITANNLTLENMVSTRTMGDKGFTIGATLVPYGTTTLTNCTMTGAKALADDAIAVDVGFPNNNVGNEYNINTYTIEGGTYGVIYCWSQSIVDISNAEVGCIYVAPLAYGKSYGEITIKSGTHVKTIKFDYGTSDNSKIKAFNNLIIEDGAKVDSVEYHGTTYNTTEITSRTAWETFLKDLSTK